MNNELLKILSSRPPQGFSTEKLLAYMRGELPAEEARVLEEILADGGMDDDAIEGLQMLPEKELNAYKHQLDAFIHQHTRASKRPRRKPLHISVNMLLFIVAILIALAVLVWYLVNELHMGG